MERSRNGKGMWRGLGSPTQPKTGPTAERELRGLGSPMQPKTGPAEKRVGSPTQPETGPAAGKGVGEGTVHRRSPKWDSPSHPLTSLGARFRQYSRLCRAGWRLRCTHGRWSRRSCSPTASGRDFVGHGVQSERLQKHKSSNKTTHSPVHAIRLRARKKVVCALDVCVCLFYARWVPLKIGKKLPTTQSGMSKMSRLSV